MTPDLTWNNIDLDHFRPLSSFNPSDPQELKEAAHFSNIQPLLKHDNRKKGPRFQDHDLMVQNQNLYEYEYLRCYK